MFTSILLAAASTFGGCDKPAFSFFPSFEQSFWTNFDFASSSKLDFSSFFKADGKFGFEKAAKYAYDLGLNKADAFASKKEFVAISKDGKGFWFEKNAAQFDFVKESKGAFDLKASKDGGFKALV